MKDKVLISIVTLVLILISTGIGCNSNKEVDNKESLMDMMKRVPQDCWSFMYVDIDAFRTDTDLEEEYGELVEGFGAWAGSAGIDFDEVDSLAGGGRSFGDMIMLFEGDYDLDAVRAKLTQQYVVSEYQGIEVWGREGASFYFVALINNKLVALGQVGNCVDAIMDVDTSLYGDEDFRLVAERLPSGVQVGLQDGALRIQEFYSAYDGIQVSGTSMTKKDEQSMIITAVCRFENGDAASSAMDTIEDDLVSYPYADFRNVDVKRDAEYIEVTCEISIEEVIPADE